MDGATQRLCGNFLESHPVSAARVLEEYAPATAAGVLAGVAPAAAAATLRRMAPPLGAEALAAMDPAAAAALLVELPLDHRVAVCRLLDAAPREAVLAKLEAEVGEPLRRLLRHPQGTVGELMDPFVLALPEDITIGEALRRARGAARGVQFHLYVVDREQRLVGVVSLHELLRGHGREPLISVVRSGITTIRVETPRESLAADPSWWEFTTLPVVDGDGVFLGQIGYAAMLRARAEAMRAAQGEGAIDAMIALGELYWQGLSGMLEGMAPGRGGAPRRGESNDGG